MYAYFEYPIKTKFNKLIPKNKIYEKVSINTALKDKIVKQIEKIVWLHKLSATTLNLNATDKITEIQVFDIELREDNLDEDVLKAIDKKKKEMDQTNQLGQQVQQLDGQLKQVSSEYQKLQQEVQRLNSEKLQLEKEKLQLDKDLG